MFQSDSQRVVTVSPQPEFQINNIVSTLNNDVIKQHFVK